MNRKLDRVLKTAKECHTLLANKKLCHVIIGGLAVHLHGHVNRKTRDVDLLIRPEDDNKIEDVLASAQYVCNKYREAYYSPHGVRIDYHWNGKKTKNEILQLPDPAAISVNNIKDLPVAALVPLIEMKLECELRRQSGQPCGTKHRDDVLGLIRLKHLDASYADKLASSVRDLFRQLVNEVSAITNSKL